jgi:hypothetical protein
MIRFEPKQHHIRNVQIVEVFDDTQFIATITPLEEREGSGFRIVSRHVDGPVVKPGMLDDEVKVWQFERKKQ